MTPTRKLYIVSMALISVTSAILLPLSARALTQQQLDMYGTNGIIYYDGDASGESTFCHPGAGGATGSVNVQGSTIKQKIWNGLISVGFTKPQAAGIMGNMQYESGFNPARHETTFYNMRINNVLQPNGKPYNIWDKGYSYGIGLIQWSTADGTRRIELLDYIQKNNPSLIKYLDDDWEKYGKLDGESFFKAAPAEAVDALIAIELQYLYLEIETTTSPDYKSFLKTTSVQEASDYFLDKIEVPGNIEQTRPVRRKAAEDYFGLYGDSSGSAGDQLPTGIQGNVIYIGDSRTVGMCTALNIGDCIARESIGYDWLVSTAIPEANQRIAANPDKNYTIVISLGINDLHKIEDYKAKYQELASTWSKHKIILTAISPVDDVKAKASGSSATNQLIAEFNNALSKLSLANGSYCPATANVTYTGGDGIHYDPNGYRKIYNEITTNCGVTSTSVTGNTCYVGGATAYTDDNRPFYLQGDSRWGNKPYGVCAISENNTIGYAGCGPTTVATIITNLTGEAVTPDTIANQGAAAGSRMCPGGSLHGPLMNVVRGYGLNVAYINIRDIAAVNTALENGALIYTSGTGASPYSPQGHIIAIRGVTASGKWKIFDSGGNGKVTSAQEWNPQAIINPNGGTAYAITR